MQKHQAYPGSLRLRLRGKDADSPDLPVHAANTAFYHHSPAGKKFFEGIIILTDISAQVEIEAAYRRELDLNKALLHHTTAFILVLDPEGRVLYFNESIAKRFGYDLEEVRGQRPWDIGVIDLQDSEFTLQRFQRLISGEDNPATEIRMRTKGGESVLVEVRSTSTRDEHGEVDRIIATAIDVTERDRLQREVLRISEREQTRIGHDLHDGVGQTMTGMISLIDALEASLEGPAKKDAARIKELASESVQEVRRLSHGLSPAAVKNRGLTGALKLLAETVRVNFRTLCDERLQQGMPELDEERETHLFRIAQEAVNNALRHGHPGKVTITLEHSETCGTLMIEDNGKGLRAARMKKASGIGLRVMEYRAQLVQGDVKVVPRPGGGVRMTCRFPIEKMAKKGRRKAV